MRGGPRNPHPSLFVLSYIEVTSIPFPRSTHESPAIAEDSGGSRTWGERARSRQRPDRSRIDRHGRTLHLSRPPAENHARSAVQSLCDVYRDRREKQPIFSNRGPNLYDDYRRVLDRKDIDAVVIGRRTTGTCA